MEQKVESFSGNNLQEIAEKVNEYMEENGVMISESYLEQEGSDEAGYQYEALVIFYTDPRNMLDDLGEDFFQ